MVIFGSTSQEIAYEEIVLDIFSPRGKLVGVIPAALVDHCKRISDELVHRVMAGTRAHQGSRRHVGLCFLCKSGTCAVLVVQTVASLHNSPLPALYLLLD